MSTEEISGPKSIQSFELDIANAFETLIGWLSSPQFYAQIAAIGTGAVLAYLLAIFIKARVPILKKPPEEGPLHDFRDRIYAARNLLFPVLAVIFLGTAVSLSQEMLGQSWLVRIGQGLAVVHLIYRFIAHFIKNKAVIALVTWVGIPVAMLFVLGWLDDVTEYLDTVSLSIGNIRLTAFALLRTLFFGAILFWFGRISNDTGKRVIRSRPDFDVGTREVIAKLFEIALYVFIFIILLQIMGINLTTLAVFGGALGVGLGFGLQQIAANFISGIIILLDRSLTLGDYIELEDGRAGTLRELNMRSATLETFDGKDIMVPNEQFITTSFVNWTHNNQKQRYPLEFQVAYKTDLPKLFDIVRKVVTSHPKVLSGDAVPVAERPDAEIASFGDSGINILVEFWMNGIDDGENRVGADLLLMIWTALQENGIEIPFPQREVQLLNRQD